MYQSVYWINLAALRAARACGHAGGIKQRPIAHAVVTMGEIPHPLRSPGLPVYQ